MRIRIESLPSGARAARGSVVVIDVFRAFTTAAVALSKGATRILMVGDVDAALRLRDAGAGVYCLGERDGRMPPGFDFPNSPAALSRADLAGKSLIQTTSNGTAGLVAASAAERLYAGALVTAEATANDILRRQPEEVTLVAMGARGGARAAEDELCALYLRALLQGRKPDRDAIRDAVLGLVPDPDPALIASGDYDPADRDLALAVDRIPFAVPVARRNGRLVATAESL
ncbi:MAG: 2-phosphosulfolactate phosphatase [Alphaproteobacteria bacterium]|jgi:2-phosphosulfolactate phosphatase|nr:2-phosphosulfolactate phosphatase [Alphaproteobacteria bacterium]